METIHVAARRWRDKVNGNTYHSVAVTMPDGTVKVHPMAYGYGTEYEWTAFELIAPKEETRHENGNPVPPWQWYERKGYNVVYDVVDVTRKRDLHVE
jgi:hypothetical protein